jgi:hypothetical protein
MPIEPSMLYHPSVNAKDSRPEEGVAMRFTSWLLVVCTVVPFLGKALESQAPSILEPRVERHEGPPLWISAQAVVNEDKIIDLDLVDSIPLRMQVEKQRRALAGRPPAGKSGPREKPSIATIPPSECKSETYVKDERGGGSSSATLSDLATRSKSIIRGTIHTIDLGFDSGVPASLLGVKVAEVVKGSVPRSLFYIAYPVARFRIGPFYFCNATKGFEPRSGDEILLFDVTGPVDKDQVLFAPRMDQIFFQSQSGALFLPPGLKNTPGLGTARSLTDVVGQIRSVPELAILQ